EYGLEAREQSAARRRPPCALGAARRSGRALSILLGLARRRLRPRRLRLAGDARDRSSCSGMLEFALLAHRTTLDPVGLRVHLALREAELVAHPRAEMLERGALRGHPRMPVRPVASLQRIRERVLPSSRHPMHAQRRAFGNRDLAIHRGVLLEIELDRHIGWKRLDDAREPGDGGGIADEKIACWHLVGHLELR